MSARQVSDIAANYQKLVPQSVPIHIFRVMKFRWIEDMYWEIHSQFLVFPSSILLMLMEIV